MRPDSATGLRLAGAQTLALTRRSVVTEWRQLGNVLPGIVFPLLLAAVYTHQFERVILLPGFPVVDSFLDFVLPASLVQSVSFGATEAGTELARDIENGFFDRLRSSPCGRLPLLLGRLGGALVVAAAKGVCIVAIFLVFGAEIAGIDLSRPIGGEDRDAVYGAFLDHHLIIIRGQALNVEQVTAAARILGDELEPAKPRTLWRAPTSGGPVF